MRVTDGHSSPKRLGHRENRHHPKHAVSSLLAVRFRSKMYTDLPKREGLACHSDRTESDPQYARVPRRLATCNVCGRDIMNARHARHLTVIPRSLENPDLCGMGAKV